VATGSKPKKCRKSKQCKICDRHFRKYTKVTIDELETKRKINNNTDLFGDHQCRLSHNRSTTDHILCLPHILEEKWEYNEAVHQLFIDFK